MSVSGRMMVRTCRIDGDQRYSWIKNQRSLFVNRTRPCSLRRNQMMAEHGLRSLRHQPQLELRRDDRRRAKNAAANCGGARDSVKTTAAYRVRSVGTCVPQ